MSETTQEILGNVSQHWVAASLSPPKTKKPKHVICLLARQIIYPSVKHDSKELILLPFATLFFLTGSITWGQLHCM